MKKIISLALTLLLCTAMLASCHGSRGLDPFVLPDAFDETKPYEITFWAKNDTNITQVEIYEQAIAGFQEIYPNITVNLRLYTDYSRIYNDVITNIATQTTPNVCITYPDHIATYMTGANVVVPLDELMADTAYGLGGSAVKFDAPTAEEIIPQFLEEGKIGGVQYALPYMRSTEACYVNKTFVEALGYKLPEVLTWDFIFEVSEAAMAKNADGTFKINGQNVLIPTIYKSTDNMMISYLRQIGAPYSTDDGEILLFDEPAKELLYEVYEHAKSGAFSTFKISSYPANFLNAGQCIFAIDSTAGATWMGSDAPLVDIAEENIVDFETEVMFIPQADPKNPVMISQGPSVCIFNKSDPGEVLASWLFTQYLLTNEIQIAYSSTEGYVPVTKKAQESKEYVEYLSKKGANNDMYYNIKLEAAELLLDHVDKTFTTSVFNGSASLRSAAGQLIENTAKSARRNQTVDEAYMDTLFSDVRAMYRLDQTADEGVQKTDFGPLPTTAVVLLSSLVTTWVLIIVYFIIGTVKNKKNKANT